MSESYQVVVHVDTAALAADKPDAMCQLQDGPYSTREDLRAMRA